jgi:hypothetical protein
MSFDCILVSTVGFVLGLFLLSVGIDPVLLLFLGFTSGTCAACNFVSAIAFS